MRAWLTRLNAALKKYIRYRITRSGYLFASALLLVGAAALASANNLLFLILAAMMATLLISGFVSRLCLAGLELELVLPEHISARQPAAVRLKIRNLKWIPSFAIRLSARAGSRPAIVDQEFVFPLLPGRAVVEVDANAMFHRRGLHRENLFTISTRFPFGFVERRAWISIASEVVIYPALEGSFVIGEVLNDLRGELEREQRGMGSDFYRLRPYEYSESSRHLDWKSSAHTGELQVREFAREERSTIYLFFDLYSQSDVEFERRIENCAYLAWMLSAESAKIRLRTQTVDMFFPDQVDIYQILRTLALAEPMGNVQAPPFDEDDPDLVFSESPDRLTAAGWRVERLFGASVTTGQTNAD